MANPLNRAWQTAITIALIVGVQAAHAAVTLPHIFGDHMVIQAGKPVKVWGIAAAGEEVTVAFAGDSQKAVAGADGKWLATLRPVAASSKATEMTVTGTNSITFRDVLVGEVWVCSGQSNMQWTISQVDNKQQEQAASATDSDIRFFTVPNVVGSTPRDDCGGKWMVCSPETAATFSAVGYHFGKHLRATVKSPVGLINSSWGGTEAEVWVSVPALKTKMPDLLSPLPAAELIDTYEKKSAERRDALQVMYAMEDNRAAAEKIAAASFDDSKWKTMAAPGAWETQGLPGLDGIVFFRKIITVPDAWAGKDIVLHLGPVDEIDVTFFNGAFVDGKGKSRNVDTKYWNLARDYRVPGSLVKAGKNVVAIRVFDAYGAGGLAGSPADAMFAELADGTDKARVSLAGEWRYLVELTLPAVPKNPANLGQPAVLFNSMIHPLIPYGIQGVIWYQGESNAGRAEAYRTLLPTLITDWRTRWGQGDFAFLVVQLANFMAKNAAPADSAWAELREAQSLTAAAMKNVGLAVAIDIGEAGDIHPRNKKEVGRRLGLAAQSIAYAQPITASGPVFDAVKIEGDKAVLTFKSIDKGLTVQGDSLKGFAIAGEDKKFVWAQAKIEGEKVVVWSDQIAKPAAVRYGWADNPDCTLSNSAGLPAAPFRTDAK